MKEIIDFVLHIQDHLTAFTSQYAGKTNGQRHTCQLPHVLSFG